MEKAPDAFRTISEVAEVLAIPAHVLRFWESRFPQIRPVKRAGGRRYYRPSDVALLSGIRRLLHDEGLTIRGVQKILREQGVRHVAGLIETEVGIPDAYDALSEPIDDADSVDGEKDNPSVGGVTVETVVDFMAKMRFSAGGELAPHLVASGRPNAPIDLFSYADADMDAPEPVSKVDDTAANRTDVTEDAPEVWLPTLLRRLPEGAFENAQAALVPLHGRLAALRVEMARSGRVGRG